MPAFSTCSRTLLTVVLHGLVCGFVRVFACVLACGLVSGVSAQTLRFGLEAAPPGLRTQVALSDFDAGWARLSLRLGVTAGTSLDLGLGARRTLTLGPLGNVILDAGTDLGTAGDLDLFVQGRGTVATVAARLRLELFNVDPGRFGWTDPLSGRPRYLALDERRLGLRVSGSMSYRLDRFLVLAVDPEVVWLNGRGVGGGVGAALQFRRLVEQDDGHALLFAALEPGGTAGFAAAGFEYRVNRAGWPALRAAAFLGGGSLGVWPGGRLELDGATGALAYKLSLALEPYRVPGPRALGSVFLGVPLGEGRLELLFSSEPGAASGTSGSLSYSVGF